jgi:hypothetical protein
VDLLRDAGSIPAASSFQGMVTPVAIPCLIEPCCAKSLCLSAAQLLTIDSVLRLRLPHITADLHIVLPENQTDGRV